MTKVEAVAQVQLATRISKTLHRELKLHCVQVDKLLAEFVVEALQDRLDKVTGRKRPSPRHQIEKLVKRDG